MGEKGTLLKVAIKLLSFQNLEDFLKVVWVLLFTLTVDEDVIKIKYHKFPNKWPKAMVHQPYKGPRCIGQAKRHDQPLKEAFICLKCSLPLITLPNSDMVITPLKSTFKNTFCNTPSPKGRKRYVFLIFYLNSGMTRAEFSLKPDRSQAINLTINPCNLTEV